MHTPGRNSSDRPETGIVKCSHRICFYRPGQQGYPLSPAVPQDAIRNFSFEGLKVGTAFASEDEVCVYDFGVEVCISHYRIHAAPQLRIGHSGRNLSRRKAFFAGIRSYNDLHIV